MAIVDETLTATFWPGEDPIGKRLKRGFLESVRPEGLSLKLECYEPPTLHIRCVCAR